MLYIFVQTQNSGDHGARRRFGRGFHGGIEKLMPIISSEFLGDILHQWCAPLGHPGDLLELHVCSISRDLFGGRAGPFVSI